MNKYRNLSETDIKLLLSRGYLEEDLPQINRAYGKTTYELEEKGKGRKKISGKKARELLGDEKFLSGLSRSAFHWDCARSTDNGDYIHFDSSALFAYYAEEERKLFA